jgi:hypothetical protein
MFKNRNTEIGAAEEMPIMSVTPRVASSNLKPATKKPCKITTLKVIRINRVKNHYGQSDSCKHARSKTPHM